MATAAEIVCCLLRDLGNREAAVKYIDTQLACPLQAEYAQAREMLLAAKHVYYARYDTVSGGAEVVLVADNEEQAHEILPGKGYTLHLIGTANLDQNSRILMSDSWETQ